MKDLFYRPDLSPKKDYMSDAELEGIAEEDLQEDELSDDDIEELVEHIDDMLDVLDILPDDLPEAIRPSLEEIKNDMLSMRRSGIDIPDIESDEDEVVFDPIGVIPTRPKDEPRKGPSLFPINDTIPIEVVPPKPLRIVLDNTFRIDKTELYRDFINRLRLVIEMYMRELLYISNVGGLPSYRDLFYYYSLPASDLPKNYKHVGDGIVRSQIERGQKAKFFKKMYNIDQTIYHLRANKASHELRKRYYDTKFQKSRNYLETQGNDLLRAERQKYDKKYEDNMYNFYKYLNSAVILVDEVLQTFLQEAKGKAILHKQGVDIFKGYREEQELMEKIKKERERERKKREEENRKQEKERLERYKTAGRNPNGNPFGQVDGEQYSPDIVPSGNNAKVVELAIHWAKTRGKGSKNPVIYSMAKRSQDMELKRYGDCSSFTRRVFLDAGKGDIGLTTAEQITNKKGYFFTDRNKLEPGDLIFFSPTGSHGHNVRLPNGKSARVAHVAIYIGGTKYVDLSAGVGTISIQDFSSGTPKRLMDTTFLAAMRH